MSRSKKIIITIIVICIILLILALIRGPEDTWICVDNDWVRHGNPSVAQPTEPCGDTKTKELKGTVTDVSPSAKVITVFNNPENKEIYLALTDNTKLFDEHQFPIDLSYFQTGFIIEAIGEMTNENSFIPFEVYVTEADNKEISWVGAEWLVNSCRVKGVGQSHAREVWIKLKNNDQLRTIEPNLDDIIDIAQAAAEKCGEIPMATE